MADESMIESEEGRLVALNAAIRWSYAVLLQMDRLDELHAALAADAAARQHRPPATSYTQQDREPFHRLHADRHFLFVAGRQLVKALKVLGMENRVPLPLRRDVTTVRDCFEHWEQQDQADNDAGVSGRAFRNFARRYPDSSPTDHRFGAGGTVIGNVPIEELRVHVERVKEELLEMERGDFVWKGWESR